VREAKANRGYQASTLVEKVQLNGLVSPNYQYVVRRIFCFGSRRPGVQVPPPRPQRTSALAVPPAAELSQESVVRATWRRPAMMSCPPSPSLPQRAQAPLGPLAGQLLAPGPPERRRRYVPAKSDALAFLATKETDILWGGWITPAAGKVSFGEFVDKWAEQQSHLRPRTVELYRYLLATMTGSAVRRIETRAEFGCPLQFLVQTAAKAIPGVA
jgi:hypothetical protein